MGWGGPTASFLRGPGRKTPGSAASSSSSSEPERGCHAWGALTNSPVPLQPCKPRQHPKGSLRDVGEGWFQGRGGEGGGVKGLT